MTVSDYDPIIEAAARSWNVHPDLLRAMMKQESGGKPNAVSSKGAAGVMQIMPGTQAALGVTNPYDPVQSIYGGAKYMSGLLGQYGHPELALAAYNAGPGRVDAYLANGTPLPAETRAYVPSIASNYVQLTRAKQAASPSVTQNTSGDVPSDEDFLKQIAPQAPQAASPSSQAVDVPSDEDFLKQIAPRSDIPAGIPITRITPPQPDPVASAPKVMGEPDVALNAVGGDQFAPPTLRNPLSQVYVAAHNALAPEGGTTYGNVLPFAKNDATGDIRLAMPTYARDLTQGAVDLAFGPALGRVTPQATSTLFNLAPGLMTSPAAGTGGMIADLAAQRANPLAVAPSPVPAPNALSAPAFVPPNAEPLTLPRIRQLIEADNQMAANKPAFVPPNTVTGVTGDVAPIRQPPNPLEIPPSAPVETPLAPPVLPSVASREAAETAAIPEKVPPAPMIPPLTVSSAENRADQLIKHFAAGKPVTSNPDVVPGYLPKLAGLTNDPGIATLERGVQAVNPGPIGLRDQSNQQAIHGFLDRLVGTPDDVVEAQAAREAATAPLREAAFANATPVNPSPVVFQIDNILASPEGKRAAVQRTLTNVRDSLFNAEGELETDPDMLYGVRKHLNDLLDPVAQKDNPQLQQAARQLLDVKSRLDDTIEQGAQGFQDYISRYSDLSKPIDAQRYLQSLNLTNAADNVRLQSVDTAIKSIERQQRMPGVQKASAITPEQLDALRTLRNTLRMDQFSATAGKHLGSNTFQNLATNSIAGQVTGNPLVSGGLGVMAGYATGNPLLGAAAFGARVGAHQMLDRSETLVRDAIVKRLLNHEGSGAAALSGKP